MNRYFNFMPADMGLNGESPKVFRYETNQFIENFPACYLPESYTEKA